jgi:hypothetical protein
MYDTPKDLLDAYRAAPDIFRALLADISQEQAANARGGDEGWSVVEVMCHLRDGEEREVERIRAMRNQDNPALPGYDQEEWARERNYAGENLQSALEAFIRFREEHIAELEALKPEEWERTGIHEDYGQIDIKAKTIHIAAHDSQHAAQIARQLRRT